MADPFRKVRPGEPIRFSATAFNTILDAAKAYKANRHNAIIDPSDQSRSSGIIRVKNDSGDDLPRHSVVGIDAPIFDPDDDENAFLREVTFSGVVPTANHLHRFAVLLEPICDGKIGRAFVDGVCQVRINVTDTDHNRADIEIDSTERLESSPEGAAGILWTETSSTGEQWAVVRFCKPCVESRTTCGPCSIPNRSIPLELEYYRTGVGVVTEAFDPLVYHQNCLRFRRSGLGTVVQVNNQYWLSPAIAIDTEEPIGGGLWAPVTRNLKILLYCQPSNNQVRIEWVNLDATPASFDPLTCDAITDGSTIANSNATTLVSCNPFEFRHPATSVFVRDGWANVGG